MPKAEQPHPTSHLADLPAVDKLLSHPKVRELSARYPLMTVKGAVRGAVSDVRKDLREGKSDADVSEEAIISLIEHRLARAVTPNLTPVINATGIILHTNLGRAPLAREALDHIVRVAQGYSNLEFDVNRGVRGSRHDHVSRLISEITGAEEGIVVNNNAAAVFLVLNTLAAGGEVIVSRGELVEIGGAFRIPDVMEKSGARLREVGTTNRTRLSDYEGAVGSDTALFLKVHTSNYRIVGFVEDTPAAQIVGLGKKIEIPVMEDLGSGSLIDFSPWGLPHEPTVQETVASGVDVITFSGDKLLGGGQGGVIIGRASLIERIRKNPLARALRIDKLTLAALEATLMLYRDPVEAQKKVPVVSMITMPYDEVKKRARRIARRLNEAAHPEYLVATADAVSGVGGGAFPTAEIPTHVVTITAQKEGPGLFEEKLRGQTPPIITRIAEDRIVIDPRTVPEENIQDLISGVIAAMAQR